MVSAPDSLDHVFAALADPTRRAILTMLIEDDMTVSDVAAPFSLGLATISKHLAVLTAAGLVSRERRGRLVWCRVEPAALHDALIWMDSFGLLRPLDLDALERFLDAEGLSPAP